MTFPPPPPEAGNQAVPEDFSFKFHQPERTPFPVSRLNLDHRRRKEGAADRKARRRRKPRRPTPPHHQLRTGSRYNLRLRFRPPTSGPFAPLVSEPGHPAHPPRSLP
jgi:hypothetical protein